MYAIETPVIEPTESNTASAETMPRCHAIEDDKDLELLKYLRMGLPEAFSILMGRHDRRLMHVAFRITGSHQDSEDAIQSTFLQVYKHIGGFNGDCKLTTWLTRIAINQSLQVLRRRKTPGISIDAFVEGGSFSLRDQLRASGATPEESILRKELRERLLAALNTLREPSRRVAELYYLQGLSCREIAGAIGISATAAKSRLVRARRELRRDGPRHFDSFCPSKF